MTVHIEETYRWPETQQVKKAEVYSQDTHADFSFA